MRVGDGGGLQPGQYSAVSPADKHSQPSPLERGLPGTQAQGCTWNAITRESGHRNGRPHAPWQGSGICRLFCRRCSADLVHIRRSDCDLSGTLGLPDPGWWPHGVLPGKISAFSTIATRFESANAGTSGLPACTGSLREAVESPLARLSGLSSPQQQASNAFLGPSWLLGQAPPPPQTALLQGLLPFGLIQIVEAQSWFLCSPVPRPWQSRLPQNQSQRRPPWVTCPLRITGRPFLYGEQPQQISHALSFHGSGQSDMAYR